MTQIIDVTDASFQTEVLDASIEKLVLLDFWAPWCGPCRAMTPALEKAAEEMTHVKFTKMNVDENTTIPTSFQVRGIPYLLMFHNGKVVGSKIGSTTIGKITEWINTCQSEAALVDARSAE